MKQRIDKVMNGLNNKLVEHGFDHIYRSFIGQLNFEFIISVRIFVLNTRVMTTKLTLTVQEGVIKRAKSYAKHTGRSLSEIIENYLETLTTEQTDQPHLSAKLRQIAGAVRLPSDFDENSALAEYFQNKHL